MSLFEPFRPHAGCLVALACLTVTPGLAVAANQPHPANPASSGRGAAPTLAYADLVDLLEPASLVLRVQIRKMIRVEPARAGNVPIDRARVYIEAWPLAALRGKMLAAQPLSYLADVGLDARGKLPDLVKHIMILIAQPVPDRQEVQLVAPDAQLPWDSALESRVRGVLDELQAPGAPARIKDVREASYVPGTLVGEGETQIFLATADGSPAAISVVHRAGNPAAQSASWSVSFSEVVDASGQPPARDTLTWYRLACSLPAELPGGSNVSAKAGDQAQAVADYHMVLAGLGACRRMRNRT